jgi:anti-anti-sigma factor
MKFENSALTIYEVEEMKELFENYLKENPNQNLILDFENVSKIDMSMLQLLVSLHKTLQRDGLKLELQNINNDIINSFHLSGISQVLGV